MVTCFDWKFHEILLNTVYLRKLSDVDAVDVHTYVCCRTYPVVGSDVRCVCTYVSVFFLSACMHFVLDKNSTTFITAH